jgi:hypothetical protein
MAVMTKLNGREASILAFIARFPASSEAKRLSRTLEGPAKRIADSLLDGSTSENAGRASAHRKPKLAAAS